MTATSSNPNGCDISVYNINANEAAGTISTHVRESRQKKYESRDHIFQISI